MKITGIAPTIAIPTFVYLMLTIIITHLYDGIFKITSQSNTIIIIAGVLLIITGAVIVANCGRRLLKTFDKGILMTEGLYKFVRNPMYAAYLVFVIPGISLLFNSWLALTTVFINYFLFSTLIKREYRYLHEKFGKQYDDYLEKVFIKFL